MVLAPSTPRAHRGCSTLTGTHPSAVDRSTGRTGAHPTEGRPVIELDHVTKRFADYLAVADADFCIDSGEFFSMLDPSGCGKTTTLRMIAGFESPTEGAIRLEGTDVSQVPPHKRNVNTVFQHYALFPHMTVWDNVAYGPHSMRTGKAEVRRAVDELLEVVRLTDFARRKPAQLSGGQQQRVALVRALVNYPSALLLDEPLGALDLKLRQVMQFELKRIQREVGITFIYVTHDQEEALTMSDRIAVMNAGNVSRSAPPPRSTTGRRRSSSPASSARLTCGRDGRSGWTATTPRWRCWAPRHHPDGELVPRTPIVDRGLERRAGAPPDVADDHHGAAGEPAEPGDAENRGGAGIDHPHQR